MKLAVAGHFGEWLQGRIGPTGPVALVTLSCPDYAVHGRAIAGPMRISGMRGHAARGFLARLGLTLPGRVSLRAGVTPGLGCGMSTARLVALARLAGWDGPPQTLARACLAHEGASDPLMFARPERILWASRLGESLCPMPALPRCDILGGFWGPPRHTDPQDMDFPDIRDLSEAWPRARALSEVAQLASESARRCLALRGPQDDPTPQLARDLGALGFTIAHTGAARGLIFAPGTLPRDAHAHLRAAGLRHVRRLQAGGA